MRDKISLLSSRIGLDSTLLVLIGLIGAVVYIVGLGNPPLRTWDESIYMNAARHMVQDGNWLIPHIYWTPEALTPFLEKPPLTYWLQAISMRVFGVSKFSGRLPSAMAAIGLAWLCYSIGRDRFDRRAGFAAACILLVLPTVYLLGHSARTGDTDAPLVLFGSLFVWWVWKGTSDPKWLIPGGIAAGLAVLTKGVAAGVFVIIALPLAGLYWRSYARREAIFGATAAVAVALPWHLYAYLARPTEFINQYVVSQVLGRSSGELATVSGGLLPFMNYPYFSFIFTSLRYGPVMIAATVFLAVRIARRGWSGSGTELFLVWWLFSPSVVFAVVGGNNSWYVLPMVVPLAIGLGLFASEIVASIDTWLETTPLSITPVVYVVGCLVFVVITIAALHVAVPHQATGEDHDQQALAESFREAPESERIYFTDDAADGHRWWVFSFYLDRPQSIASPNEITSTNETAYAVVTPGEAAASDEFTPLYKSEEFDVVAVRSVE
ncbi:glycosyltransferase family 39 protein [Saliphagus sp. LR7]|uniref:ArnT family glycosyltransferase n=1 Tax=Saliphagus sp. LR7 TaxID=2282654 RepID=UPI0013009D25|nr:glycosyltransferase family 39 protein [Saliphagus sp. LR7]